MDPEVAWRMVIEKEIAGLRNEVDSIKQYLYSSGDIKKILESKLALLEGKTELIRVYLQCDGEKTVGEIAEITGIARPNVSRAIANLKRSFLVYQTTNSHGKKVYARNLFDEQMGLVRELAKRV